MRVGNQAEMIDAFVDGEKACSVASLVLIKDTLYTIEHNRYDTLGIRVGYMGNGKYLFVVNNNWLGGGWGTQRSMLTTKLKDAKQVYVYGDFARPDSTMGVDQTPFSKYALEEIKSAVAHEFDLHKRNVTTYQGYVNAGESGYVRELGEATAMKDACASAVGEWSRYEAAYESNMRMRALSSCSIKSTFEDALKYGVTPDAIGHIKKMHTFAKGSMKEAENYLGLLLSIPSDTVESDDEDAGAEVEEEIDILNSGLSPLIPSPPATPLSPNLPAPSASADGDVVPTNEPIEFEMADIEVWDFDELPVWRTEPEISKPLIPMVLFEAAEEPASELEEELAPAAIEEIDNGLDGFVSSTFSVKDYLTQAVNQQIEIEE